MAFGGSQVQFCVERVGSSLCHHLGKDGKCFILILDDLYDLMLTVEFF